MDKLPLRTPDLTERNFAALTALFPNAVTESIDENGIVVRAIDADILRQEINTHVVSGKEERYQFTWPDKKKAVLLANAPIAATLRPCREESVDFDNTENLYIEGDNLDVLKLLRETYLNRVKMIYIDPPYNTGNDFIYEDDFSENASGFLARDFQYDEDGNRMVRNLDSNGRFHTDWLNMIYPRLRIAKDLLADDGVIFISIDDNEIGNLKKICNEIFGEMNFIANIVWKHTQQSKNDELHFSRQYNHILAYTKKIESLPNFYFKRTDEDNKNYSNPDDDPKGLWRNGDVRSPNYRKTLCYDIIAPDGKVIKAPENGWRWSEESIKKKFKSGEVIFKKDYSGIIRKIYLSEQRGRTPENLWDGDRFGTTRQATAVIKELFEGLSVFDTPKPKELVVSMARIAADNDSIILDFFSGSSTTAHAVMQLNAEDGGNRKFIMVQLPEACDESSEAAKAGYKNICEIGKERIRRAGAKTKTDTAGKEGNLDIGFRVLKLDSSNMKNVYYTPQEMVNSGGTFQLNLDGLVDNIKPDRNAEDLLFQVMLDLGLPLSSKIEQRTVDGKAVFSVADNHLMACFGRATDKIVTELAKSKPYYAVFRDSSFTRDATLVNFEQIFKTYSPTTIRKVL
ncbi:MAG: site-specific DNA-methyltransferase [Proteobacteria bacterium]|nr:site-specific DNA-methyltransferase [Cystobacterineae bacterium]MCL2258957.1 site-specific DNA-methyltransferase [Cystobacterineae bacterium]MCL2314885.1 site-specific DNA-methyltransferase [Pseudomonadota bacterium]